MKKSLLPLEINQYCLDYGVRENPILKKLRKATSLLTQGNIHITPDQGALLAMLVNLISAKSCLEIGTYTGYSTLWLALHSAKDAKITTLDISDRYLSIAYHHWQEAQVMNKIETIIAPAQESLAKLIRTGRKYDLAFIDANKSQYLAYYEACINLVRTNGLVIIDNVLMYGQILETKPHKNYVKYLQEFNLKLRDDSRIDLCMLSIGDGFTLARKK